MYLCFHSSQNQIHEREESLEGLTTEGQFEDWARNLDVSHVHWSMQGEIWVANRLLEVAYWHVNDLGRYEGEGDRDFLHAFTNWMQDQQLPTFTEEATRILTQCNIDRIRRELLKSNKDEFGNHLKIGGHYIDYQQDAYEIAGEQVRRLAERLAGYWITLALWIAEYQCLREERD